MGKRSKYKDDTYDLFLIKDDLYNISKRESSIKEKRTFDNKELSLFTKDDQYNIEGKGKEYKRRETSDNGDSLLLINNDYSEKGASIKTTRIFYFLSKTISIRFSKRRKYRRRNTI